MLIFLYVVLSIILLIAIIFYMSLRVEFFFVRGEDDDRREITFSILGGLLRYRWRVPKGDEMISSTKAAQQPKVNKLSLLERLKRLNEIFLREVVNMQRVYKWFFSKITCEKLVWTTTLGTGDAAETGVVTGLAWGIKNSIVGMFGSYICWKHAPVLYVNPNFNHTTFEYYCSGIIRFRIGHAIVGAKRLVQSYRKWR